MKTSPAGKVEGAAQPIRPAGVAGAVICFGLALFLLQQFLGLLLISRYADAAREADGQYTQVYLPLSVQFVGFVANRLHEEVLHEPLDPDGTNWPVGFRLFFILELSGLAGLIIALAQMGAGILKRRADWRRSAATIATYACLALLIGVLLLKLTR